MAKTKNNNDTTIAKLNSAARMARTALAGRLLAHGFYAGQDQIMLALHTDDGLTTGQLAERVGVRPPTITKTINRLQDQGFVERRASERDGRQTHVHLTETGQSALSAINRAIRKTEKSVLAGLTGKERKRLKKLLSQIEMNLIAKTGRLAS